MSTLWLHDALPSWAVVRRQRAGFAFEREFGAADAVAVAADERAEVRSGLEIAVQIIVAEHDIAEFAVFVRHFERLDDAAVGHDARFHSLAVAQGVNCHRRAVRGIAEGSLADGSDCVGWYWHGGAAYKTGGAQSSRR